MLCVTPRHRVIGYHEVSRGQLIPANVHPRDVFRVAILANADGVILAHNRRGTDATPAEEDIAIARALQTAGQVLGIPVFDHIVIAGDRHVSLRSLGLL